MKPLHPGAIMLEQPHPPTAIVSEQLSKTYTVGTRVVAVNAVDLTIPHRSYTTLMGPRSSSKSTLTELIGLLDAPSSGPW